MRVKVWFERGGVSANPGVVEFGLDADHFAFFLELGAQDAEL